MDENHTENIAVHFSLRCTADRLHPLSPATADRAGNQPNYRTDRSHSGAIYLLHAISTTNASILGDAIDSFRAQGYEITLFQ